MQRVSTILLAILAVVVFGAAVYVIKNNGTTTTAQDSVTSPSTTPVAATPSTSPPVSVSSSASSSPSPSAKPVVAFLGDEWTSGVGASAKAKRFTSLLAGRLGIVERNLGRRGAGYADGTGYDSRVAAVTAAHPDVVVVSGGRNDIVANNGAAAEAATAALFRDLHAALPKAVLIAVAPMWGDSVAPPGLMSLGKAVEKAVTAAGGTYVDVADPITGHPEFMADGADPDDRGYAAIANALAPTLAPLLRG